MCLFLNLDCCQIDYQGTKCGNGRIQTCYHTSCSCICDRGWTGGCCSESTYFRSLSLLLVLKYDKYASMWQITEILKCHTHNNAWLIVQFQREVENEKQKHSRYELKRPDVRFLKIWLSLLCMVHVKIQKWHVFATKNYW